MEENKFKFPTETIELPSKGLIYPEDNPLSSGTIEMKYMTAKEEDILSNQSYIQNGTVLDKLLKSLIVSEIDYNDLIVGDKNAIMIAARVLGYGKDYEFEYKGEQVSVDLSSLENRKFDEKAITRGVNEFSYTLPTSGTIITYKLLTHKDLKKDLLNTYLESWNNYNFYLQKIENQNAIIETLNLKLKGDEILYKSQKISVTRLIETQNDLNNANNILLDLVTQKKYYLMDILILNNDLAKITNGLG